jgi:hypothetical protein
MIEVFVYIQEGWGKKGQRQESDTILVLGNLLFVKISQTTPNILLDCRSQVGFLAKSVIEDAAPRVKSKASTKFIERTAKPPSMGGA